MKKVFVNGYGSIGNRIAKFINMTLILMLQESENIPQIKLYNMLSMMAFPSMFLKVKLMIFRIMMFQDQLNPFWMNVIQ